VLARVIALSFEVMFITILIYIILLKNQKIDFFT